MPSMHEGQLNTQRGHDFDTYTVRDVDPTIHLLQAEIAPIFTTLLNMNRGAKARSTKIEWIEDEFIPHATKINAGGGYGTGILTFIVDNEEYGNIGAFLYCPRTNETMGPVMAKDNGASTLTIKKRGAFGTTPAALVDNDVLIFLRGNIKDGGDAAEAIVTLPTTKFNYIEPTSTTWNVSEMLEEIETYGGVNKIKYLSAKKMKEHMEEIEKKILNGQRGIDTTTDTGIRYAMGGLFYQIISTITTISVGVGATKGFTFKQWNSWMRNLFQYNQSSAEKIVYCSGDIIEQIDEWKLQSLDLDTDDFMIDIAARSIRNSFGTVHLVHHRMFNETFGRDWTALAVDPAKISYIPFQAQRVRRNIQERRTHARIDEIYDSGSLKVTNEQVHGIFQVQE